MTDQQLQAIKERFDNATSGPRVVVKSEKNGTQIGTAWEHGQLGAGLPIVTTAHGVGGVTVYMRDGDAEFIANSITDTAALIAEVEQLRKSLAFYEKVENHERIFSNNTISKVDLDAGEIARRALEGSYTMKTSTINVSPQIAEAREKLLVDSTMAEVFNWVTADYEVNDPNVKILAKWHVENDDEGQALMQLLLGQFEIVTVEQKLLNEFLNQQRLYSNYAEHGEMEHAQFADGFMCGMRFVLNEQGVEIEGVNK